MSKSLLSLCLLSMLVFEAYGQANHDAASVAGLAVNPPEGRLKFNVGGVQFVPDIKGVASGNDRKNWQGYGSLNLGAKVWESNNGKHKIGAGLSVNKAAGSHQGFNWQSKPNYGGGLHYQYNFGR